MQCAIKKATSHELNSIAHIHKEAFPDHFLGKFPVFVIKRFYSFFMDTIFLVSLNGKNPSGFVMGGEAKELSLQKQAFMRQSKFIILMGALISPAIWKECFSRFMLLVKRRSSKDNPKTVSNKEQTPDSIRLLSIAVTPSAKGSCTAQTLVLAFEENIPRHVTNYGLSVKKDNIRAVRFYKKMGFKIEKEKDGSLYLIKEKCEKAAS